MHFFCTSARKYRQYVNPLFRGNVNKPEIDHSLFFLLQVAGGGTGYLRLWFAPPEGVRGRKEAFLFVDSDGQNEECLLIRMQGVQ